MKSLILGLALALTAQAKLPENEANVIVNAIYRIEGGAKTKFYYGIKSIQIKGNTEAERMAYAQKICLNTVQATHDRWIKAGRPGKYLDFLANRYCPVVSDKQGNVNWKKNIRKVSGLDF